MRSALEDVLRGGPQAAPELRAQLSVSQPTLSRMLGAARGDIAVFGRGRATRYARYRRVRDLPPELPVHRVSIAGESAHIGTLHTIAPDRYWYEDHEHPAAGAQHYSLPWFITDMRPQGYLGRFFPQTYSDLGLPERITDWSEDQALYAIARRGEDTAGNLIVGEESYARWLTLSMKPQVLRQTGRAARYAELADEAVAGRAAGSSAAGEQPKFGVTVAESAKRSRHVLVKFSGSLRTPAGRRWSDLLLAEHIASVILREHGHSAARSEYLRDATRAYLEVERFDRTGARGRMGLVSLGALDDEYVGERRGWSESAAALLRARLIDVAEARELRFLSAFGAQIANNDMHLGNASFLTDGYLSFRLAPAYDMLPMLYAPLRDEVPNREFVLPAPRPAHSDQWRPALPVAREFWLRVADDARASTAFRRIARTNAQQIVSV